MIRNLAALLLLGSSLVACVVDSPEPATPEGPTARACNTQLAITGSVTNRPATFDDFCQAVGTWKFTQTIDAGASVEGDCTPAPALAPIEIDIRWECPAGKDCSDSAPDPADFGYAIDLKKAPAMAAKNHIKLTNGGSGICEGIVELYSADGKDVFNLHPNLNADGSLVGQGEYAQYDNNQWDQ